MPVLPFWIRQLKLEKFEFQKEQPNNNIIAEGLSAFTGLVNLLHLDLERCPLIHGGLVHLRGLSKLQALNINCCNCITDSHMEPLTELINLKELQLSTSKVTDHGVTFLKGLHKLSLLNMERCPITTACLDSLSDLADAIGAGCFVAHEAATMWEFSKRESVGGLQSLGRIDSPEKFHDRITIYEIQQKHMVLSACAYKRIMGFD